MASWRRTDGTADNGARPSLGLRPFLRQKLVERLQLEEEQEAAGKRRA